MGRSWLGGLNKRVGSSLTEFSGSRSNPLDTQFHFCTLALPPRRPHPDLPLGGSWWKTNESPPSRSVFSSPPSSFGRRGGFSYKSRFQTSVCIDTSYYEAYKPSSNRWGLCFGAVEDSQTLEFAWVLPPTQRTRSTVRRWT